MINVYMLKGGDGIDILKFDVLTSTSTYARENAASLRLPSLIIADAQTAGRGRRGNSFYSPESSGLYMTLLFEQNNDFPLITPAAAVAVCSVIEKEFGIFPKIKWVNDIFLDGKKICGILSEAFAAEGRKMIAVGIGINLTTEAFPESIPNAGALGLDCDKQKLAEKISRLLLEYYADSDSGFILNEYEKRLFIIGRTVEFYENNQRFTATVKGINSMCNLIVEMPDKTEKTLCSGEISIIL